MNIQEIDQSARAHFAATSELTSALAACDAKALTHNRTLSASLSAAAAAEQRLEVLQQAIGDEEAADIDSAPAFAQARRDAEASALAAQRAAENAKSVHAQASADFDAATQAVTAGVHAICREEALAIYAAAEELEDRAVRIRERIAALYLVTPRLFSDEAWADMAVRSSWRPTGVALPQPLRTWSTLNGYEPPDPTPGRIQAARRDWQARLIELERGEATDASAEAA